MGLGKPLSLSRPQSVCKMKKLEGMDSEHGV